MRCSGSTRTHDSGNDNRGSKETHFFRIPVTPVGYDVRCCCCCSNAMPSCSGVDMIWDLRLAGALRLSGVANALSAAEIDTFPW